MSYKGGFSTYVGVAGWWSEFVGVLPEALALALYEGLYELIPQVAVADSYRAGLAEQRWGAVPLEGEESLGCAEIYLLRLTSREQSLYYGPEVSAYPFSLGDEVSGAVGAVFPRLGRKILLDVGIVVVAVGTHVRGDTLTRVVYPYLRGGESDIYLLADQAVGHRVGVALRTEGDKAVRRHLKRGPALELERCLWKRCEHRFFGGKEALAARVVASGQTLLVIAVHKFRDGIVQFLERMEHMVAQRCVDMAVSLVDGIFHQSLVLWLADSRGLGDTQVVVGKIVHARGQVRLVGIRSLDRRLEIVGNEYLRNAAEELQGLDGGRQELFYTLRADA